MQITQRIVRKPPEHLGIPVIDAGKHPEHGSHTHHQVEMRNDKIGVVYLYVDRGITQKNPRQSPGNEHAHKSDGEEHGRRKAYAPPP